MTATDAQPATADAGAPPAGDASALRVESITHRYPPSKRRRRSRGGESPPPPSDRPALQDVQLDVRPGEVFALLGPNGSGKSTLFRIISTLLRPTEGRVTVFGHDPQTDPRAVREQLGVVFQSPALDVKLTARENLRHHGRLYGLGGTDLDKRIDNLLGQFGLADRGDEFVERFSGGMQRRVEIAKAMLHGPRLLLMDEPATGLDPGARRDLWQQLDTLRRDRGITIALTTHLMDEADRCDRLAILARGRVVAVDTPAALKARIGGDVITVAPHPDTPGSTPGNAPASAPGSSATANETEPAESLAREIDARFAPWPEGGAPAVVDGAIKCERENGAEFVAQLTSAFPDRIRSVTVGQPTLDDVFLHLTGHAIWEDE